MMASLRQNNPTPIQIVPYQRRSRHEVRELLFRSYRSHTHLDWRESDQWLDEERAPIKLAYSGRRLIGILGVSEPINGECWIRMAAVADTTAHDNSDSLPAMEALWTAVRADLRAMNVRRVALLMLRDWLGDTLTALGFRDHEWVVTLRRVDPQPPPEAILTNGIIIRAAEPTDSTTILGIDHAAFGPLWRMTYSDLRAAMRMAASCSVAVQGDMVIGYQLSTMYFDGSHLARLAVLPDQQSRGIGGLLVSDVLRRFQRRGVLSMTVNTQLSNEQSQRVYRRLGFERNGYDMRVCVTDL